MPNSKSPTGRRVAVASRSPGPLDLFVAPFAGVRFSDCNTCFPPISAVFLDFSQISTVFSAFRLAITPWLSYFVRFRWVGSGCCNILMTNRFFVLLLFHSLPFMDFCTSSSSFSLDFLVLQPLNYYSQKKIQSEIIGKI